MASPYGKRRAVPASQGINSLALAAPNRLPNAVLAAVIILAIATLLDLAAFTKSCRYNKPNVFVLGVTFSVVLMFGVEVGILAGIITSLGLYLQLTSRPRL